MRVTWVHKLLGTALIVGVAAWGLWPSASAPADAEPDVDHCNEVVSLANELAGRYVDAAEDIPQGRTFSEFFEADRQAAEEVRRQLAHVVTDSRECFTLEEWAQAQSILD